MNLKDKILLLFVQTYQERKGVPFMEMSRDKDRKRKNLPIWKRHVRMIKEDAYISKEMQLQNHSFTFFQKNYSLLSATSTLSRSPMAYNTTASLDNVTCTDYVDVDKFENLFGQFSRSKNDSIHVDVKLKVFKKDDNKEFRLVQNLTIGGADFNQFMQLRNQLVNAAE